MKKMPLPPIKIWRWLTSPLFILWLLMSGSWSYLQLALTKIRPYQSIIFSLTFFVLSFLLVSSQVRDEKTLSDKASLQNRQLIVLQKQLEAALQQQPTHRDILLNLAKISQELEQTEQAQFYWEQAQQLDPNHSHFAR